MYIFSFILFGCPKTNKGADSQNTLDSVSSEQEELVRVNKDELIYDWDTDELLYQNEPFTGLAFEVQYNGERESECPYLNGFPHGTCTRYYSDGKTPFTLTNYNNGTKHGVKKDWYPSGRLDSLTHYENGIKQGDFVDRIDEPGNAINLKGQYENGKKNGLWVTYKV